MLGEGKILNMLQVKSSSIVTLVTVFRRYSLVYFHAVVETEGQYSMSLSFATLIGAGTESFRSGAENSTFSGVASGLCLSRTNS